jgi:hypothetical protein
MRKILLGVIVAACGPGGGGGAIPIHSLESEVASTLCTFEANCGLMPDVATCEATIQIDDDETLTLIAAVDAGKVRYDGNAARTCLNHYPTTTCSFSAFLNPDPSCAATFTGTVAMGGTCAINQECANQAPCTYTPMCSPSTMCCMGTCGAPPGQVGAPCNATGNSPCATGLYCSTSKANTCQQHIAMAGATCDAGQSCAGPLVCDFCTGRTNTCVMPPATGATCTPMTGIGCADLRDYCDRTTMTCTRAVAVGQTCGGTNLVPCVGYAACSSGTCVARPTSGQACGAANQPACLGGLTCTGGTCQLPAAGMACPL